jgi:flagellar biosynthetic protein FlhB/flagellar biosynthesis protein
MPSAPSEDEANIAVAIKYRKDEDKAPRVVAKGMNLRAEKIKEIAKQHNIPMMKNIALAHALNKVDVGEEIPEDLYDAVAEVLNFVFALANPTEPPK